MTTLNAAAADALRGFAPNAVTDVTGFGLFGHAHETAERSGVRIVLDAAALPALPGALEAARAGTRTGGDPRNREFAPVEADGVAEELLALGYDAQTAGGLLVTLPGRQGALARGGVPPARPLPRAGRFGGGGQRRCRPLASLGALSARSRRWGSGAWLGSPSGRSSSSWRAARPSARPAPGSAARR